MSATAGRPAGLMSSANDVRAHMAQTGLGKLPSLDKQTLEKMKAEAMKKAKALQEKVGPVAQILEEASG